MEHWYLYKRFEYSYFTSEEVKNCSLIKEPYGGIITYPVNAYEVRPGRYLLVINEEKLLKTAYNNEIRKILVRSIKHTKPIFINESDLEKLIDDTMIVFKKSYGNLANNILCRAAIDKK